MRSPAITIPAVFVVAAIAACGLAARGVAQSASHEGEIPQSLTVEHQDTLDQLANLGRRHGPVGVEARKALELFKRHLLRENAFILPPLTLLPYLADGKVTPDMKWAIAMADRVKAEREEIFQEHTQITDAMNALAAAARATHDAEALAFAQSAVTDSLNDSEIGEPMAIVIGDYVKLKLQAGQ
jgi:hypothetical protein